MKKHKGIPFEEVLAQQLKNEEVRLRFEQNRFYLQVAHLVAELRRKKEFSQAELAKKSGVSQPLIARLESGDQRRVPTFDTLHKILKALGYSIEIKFVQNSKKQVA